MDSLRFVNHATPSPYWLLRRVSGRVLRLLLGRLDRLHGCLGSLVLLGLLGLSFCLCLFCLGFLSLTLGLGGIGLGLGRSLCLFGLLGLLVLGSLLVCSSLCLCSILTLSVSPSHPPI